MFLTTQLHVYPRDGEEVRVLLPYVLSISVFAVRISLCIRHQATDILQRQCHGFQCPVLSPTIYISIPQHWIYSLEQLVIKKYLRAEHLNNLSPWLHKLLNLQLFFDYSIEVNILKMILNQDVFTCREFLTQEV